MKKQKKTKVKSNNKTKYAVASAFAVVWVALVAIGAAMFLTSCSHAPVADTAQVESQDEKKDPPRTEEQEQREHMRMLRFEHHMMRER